MIIITEHKTCEKCQWNHYPECYGTIMIDGNFLNIENLTKGFECGQKDQENLTDFSIIKKSDLEFRVEELENKVNELEAKEVSK